MVFGEFPNSKGREKKGHRIALEKPRGNISQICQKALSASNSTQLYDLFKAGLLNADNDKKFAKNDLF